MKKTWSIFLSLIMTFTLTDPVYAMDTGLTKNVAMAGTAGAIAVIAAAVPAFAVWIAANPALSAGLIAFVSTLVPNLVGDMVINGIIVHYNWIIQKITYIGLQ